MEEERRFRRVTAALALDSKPSPLPEIRSDPTVPLIERVRRLLGDRDTVEKGAYVLHECRRCGTTLDSKTDRCEACGARDVARFLIE